MAGEEFLREFLTRSAKRPIRDYEGVDPRCKGGEMALTGNGQVITLEVRKHHEDHGH
jgi:hypothetical protein